MSAEDWLAAWAGPAGLRLWVMSGASVIEGPEQVADLATARARWPDLPMLLAAPADPAGGASSRPVPCPAALRLDRVADGGPLWRVAAVSQADPPGLLAGELAPIAGLLAAHPQFDGVALLTGPRSHWVRISAGEICHFHSFLTGELLTLLSPEATEGEGFAEALGDALSRPHRAYGQLAHLPTEGGHARRAGLLIGLELAAAKPYWLGQQVAILDGVPQQASLAGLYAQGLSLQGAHVLQPDAQAGFVAGMYAAWKTLDGRDTGA